MALGPVVSLMFEMLGHRELLALRVTSRELHALASDDHAWAEAWKTLVEELPPLGQNEQTMAAYPKRASGERRHRYSSFPCEAERVELAGFVLPDITTAPVLRVTLHPLDSLLEDAFHPESEDADTNCGMFRSVVYKARPLPLRCDLCDVECDSYISFTNHCLLFEHKVNVSLYTAPKPANYHRRRNSDLLGRVVQRVVC